MVHYPTEQSAPSIPFVVAWQTQDNRCTTEFDDAGIGLPACGGRPPAATRLDLTSPTALEWLRRTAAFWSAWTIEARLTWLQSQEIIVPPRALSEPDIALLPGGAVAVRGPAGILVCDPVRSVTFSESEAKQLRTVLCRRADAVHLLHLDGGVVQVRRLPNVLPSQAVTIVQDASRLAGGMAANGPALIQWCNKGAAGWPLVEAPTEFALAGSVAASPVARQGLPVAAEYWHAPDTESRCRLLRPGIAERVSDLLCDEVPDDLRYAIVDSCVAHRDSLADRIAVGLSMLPACFHADALMPPGGWPTAWERAIAHVQQATQPQAMLVLENVGDPLSTFRALRNLLKDTDTRIFTAASDMDCGEPVSLWHDAALFLGRRTQPHGRICLVVPVPMTPVDLYALASSLVEGLGIAVTAAAPCWGFCHRIGPDGREAGNAGWFGMGAGLDEVDVLIGELDL